MTFLSDDNEAEIIETFNSTSRDLDNLLNIDIPYFEGTVNQMYLPALRLNKAKTSDTEAPCLVLHLYISNGFVSSKIYDKGDDFDFDMVNFPFMVMVMFNVVLFMECIFFNLLDLLECVVM